VFSLATKKETELPKLPVGVVGGLRWHQNNHDLAFTLTSARGPGDANSIDVASGKLERWTNSETAVKTDAFPEAQRVNWKSFDGQMISGFLYRPAANSRVSVLCSS
jgi:dipeptidyl aminopeptidase/acylaminoacyl peptidase